MDTPPVDMGAVEDELTAQLKSLSVRQEAPRKVWAGSRQAVYGVGDLRGLQPARIGANGERVNHITMKLRKDEVLRLLLSNHNTREISDYLRVSAGTIREYIRDPEFQEELKIKNYAIWQKVDQEIQLHRISKTQQLDEMGETALARMRELLDSEDERVVFKAAADTLDRVKETSKHHQIDTTQLTFNVPAEALMLAAQTALEIEGSPKDVSKEAKEAKEAEGGT